MATPAAPPSGPSQPLTVLVVGANGYLGSAVCRAFLRSAGPSPFFFRVFGLVRRESTALALAADEIVPIVGSVDDPDALSRKVLSHSPTWDVIVVCTEPSKLDPASEDQHWRDILSLVETLAESSASASSSQQRPVRPMVLWSSGCKDYGFTALHGDADLQPHTEESPLVPHPLVRGRMDGAMRALAASQNGGGFDVAVVRATPVYGYSGSYMGATFDYVDAYVAALSDKDDKVLKIPSHEGTIMHGCHVDDCGDGYVALAKTALFGGKSPWTTSHWNGSGTVDRKAIAGQQFNISSRRYETLREIGTALAKEYGLSGGAVFGVSPQDLPGTLSNQDMALVFGYSQWVSSDKIRAVTGWSDNRPLFHENIGALRCAYNAAKERGSENIIKTRQRMGGNWGDS